MELRKWLSFCRIKLLFFFVIIILYPFLVSGEFGDHDPMASRSGYLSGPSCSNDG